MKKTLRLAAAVMALIFVLSSCGGGKDAVTTGGKYMFVTGKNGGTYHSLGTAMATVIDKHLESTTTIVSSTGSLDNIDMLSKGDADFAFCQSDILYYAMNGKELYNENFKKNLSVAANLYTESVQFIVNADSEIEKIDDLKGMSVAVGNYGTATEAAARQILEAYGITYDDITVRYQSFSEATKGLSEGTIDAAVAVSSLPSANVYEYSEARPIRCLPVNITNAAKLKRSCPFFSDGIIPSEVYGCENTVSTLNIDILLICRSDLSSDAVYSVVATVFDHLDELRSAHIRGSDIFVETAGETRVGNMHAGARRYFQSAANAEYDEPESAADETPAEEAPAEGTGTAEDTGSSESESA